jgi:voltage-gated potassium channel
MTSVEGTDVVDQAIVPQETHVDRVRTWWRRFWRGESFYPLFVLLLTSVVFIIAGDDRRWAIAVGNVLAAASLLFTVRPSRASRVWLVLGWVALALGVAGALVQSLTETKALHMVGSAIFLLVLFSSLPLILRRLVSHSVVTAETIVGALCAYLLIGMDFALLHVIFSVADGQSIITSIVEPGVRVTRGDFYYHSFMTLTTVGYGDFVPRAGSAKTLSLLEGILGQLFLVTVVARLVAVATFRRARS